MTTILPARVLARCLFTTLLALLLSLSLVSCAVDHQISVAEALPPGATETYIPVELQKEFTKAGAKQLWFKAYKSTMSWDEVCAHLAQVAKDHNYKDYPTPPIPNIDRVHLSKEQVLKCWASPAEIYGLGVLNARLLYEKGGKIDSGVDYIIFCGGGAF